MFLTDFRTRLPSSEAVVLGKFSFVVVVPSLLMGFSLAKTVAGLLRMGKCPISESVPGLKCEIMRCSFYKYIYPDFSSRALLGTWLNFLLTIIHRLFVHEICRNVRLGLLVVLVVVLSL